MNSNKAILETHSQRDRRWFKDHYITQRERTIYSNLTARIKAGAPVTADQADFVANIGSILKQRGE